MKKPIDYGLKAYVPARGKIILIICCCFLCFGAGAQTAENEYTKTGDPVLDYLSQHRNTPLVRQYYQYPGDPDLAILVKTSLILENPSLFGEFSETDLARMRDDYKIKMLKVDFIERQVQSGMSYENAKISYSRQASKEVPSGKSVVQEIEPMLVAPGNQ